MTDAQLTALSTIAWIVGTSTVFLLLAHWSDGGSWGIANAVARGLIGWTGRNGAIAGGWPSPELPPLDLSPGARPKQLYRSAEAEESTPAAVLEDLGSRHLG